VKSILLTGALGQLGSEFVTVLRSRFGADKVVATDIRASANPKIIEEGPFYQLDARDGARLLEIVRRHRVDMIFHLAALLSAVAEREPQRAWEVNLGGLYAVLEVAREAGCSVFTPSSIAAFGPTTIRDYTPQDAMQRPTSMYGITKVTGELLCDYYHFRYGVDTRGVRFPGIISNVTMPGGGTTDFAVEIYYAAVDSGTYKCFLKGDTYLDMMYMPDAIKAALDLMDADPGKLRHRNAFNVTAMSFCPEDQAAYIRKYMPDFEITYEVDPVRQALANSWPNSLEDYAARVEWGFSPEYDLDSTTREMLSVLTRRRASGPAPCGEQGARGT